MSNCKTELMPLSKRHAQLSQMRAQALELETLLRELHERIRKEADILEKDLLSRRGDAAVVMRFELKERDAAQAARKGPGTRC